MRAPRFAAVVLLAALACPGPAADVDPPDLEPGQTTFTAEELHAALYSDWRAPAGFFEETDDQARAVFWLDENDIIDPAEDEPIHWPRQLCSETATKVAEWLGMEEASAVMQREGFWEVQGGVSVWRIHRCTTFDTSSTMVSGVHGELNEVDGITLGWLNLAERTPEALADFVERLWTTSGSPLDSGATRVLSTFDEAGEDGSLSHVLMEVVGARGAESCDRVLLFEDRFELAADDTLTQTRTLVDEVQGECHVGGCG